MKIENRTIEQLANDPNNARKHDDKNINAIKGSLAKFGQQKPIVIDKNNVVIAGNGTLEAARQLGWQTIEVVVTKLDSFNKTAFALADNRTAELAEWDQSVLDEQLLALDEFDFDVTDIGFELPGINDDDNDGSDKDDEIPEIPKDQNPYGVKLGDIWQLGEHRLMCGDSTDKDQIDKLMAGEKADMVFTDPPYDISAEGRFKSSYAVNVINASQYQKWDDGFEYTKIMEIFPTLIHEKGNIFCFSSSYHCWKSLLPYFYEKFEICTMFIWAKKFAVANVRQVGFAKSYEPAIYCWNKGHIFNAKPGTENYDVQYFASNEGGRSYEHPTSKPLALVIHIISILSNNLVVDLFLGSGSTLIACEKTGRRCFGSEIDPHYCSVIIKRWEDFTGKKAVKL